MPMPAVVLDRYPWVCSHQIPEDMDGCLCGARQAWPRQLEFDYEEKSDGQLAAVRVQGQAWHLPVVRATAAVRAGDR